MKHVARGEVNTGTVEWWVEEAEDGPELLCKSTADDGEAWQVARMGSGSLVLEGGIGNGPGDSFCDLDLDDDGFIKVTKDE